MQGTKWRVVPIPLTTVRPFVMEDIVLNKFEDQMEGSIHNADDVADFLTEKVCIILHTQAIY